MIIRNTVLLKEGISHSLFILAMSKSNLNLIFDKCFYGSGVNRCFIRLFVSIGTFISNVNSMLWIVLADVAVGALFYGVGNLFPNHKDKLQEWSQDAKGVSYYAGSVHLHDIS